MYKINISNIYLLIFLEMPRAAKSQKDPNAPKRPLSAFFLFSQDERPKIKKEIHHYQLRILLKLLVNDGVQLVMIKNVIMKKELVKKKKDMIEKLLNINKENRIKFFCLCI